MPERCSKGSGETAGTGLKGVGQSHCRATVPLVNYPGSRKIEEPGGGIGDGTATEP